MTETKPKKKHTDLLEEDYRYKEYDAAIMGRLMSYLRPYAWRVTLAAVIMAAIALIALARPWIVSQIVDVGIGQGQPAYLFSGEGTNHLCWRLGDGYSGHRIGCNVAFVPEPGEERLEGADVALHCGR